MNVADKSELDRFLQQHPDIEMLELLMPDVNGLLRCKRIQRREFDSFFDHTLKAPISTPLLAIRGDLYDEADPDLFAGDPDQLLLPISGTLSTIPWMNSPTGQVLAGFAELDHSPVWTDTRVPLAATLDKFALRGLQPVVATELEFYLLAPGSGDKPRPLLGEVPGLATRQEGIQYCMPDDMFDCDEFLNDVRKACELQSVPLTAIHSEFSPGQWEINTHHQQDPLLACDHAQLLKRIIKGVARQHGFSATFMAKPFGEMAGSGLHIHTSVYDSQGNNIFSDPAGDAPPAISDRLRHAVGGMSRLMAESMAIFAPNANSYRRFTPGAYAPTSPTWGYNHREVALRIPVSPDHNRRIEHRVAGADANPYLTVAAVLAGALHGINSQCEPGPETPVGRRLDPGEACLPRRWDGALELFRQSAVLPQYLGEQYCKVFAAIRQGESDDFHSRVSNLDYEWYLRAL
jgi:glutamine synthetase